MLNTLINFIYPSSAGKNNLKRKIRSFTGFRPGNIDLYKSALTHKSLNNTPAKDRRNDNERLEFLGDALLSAIIADYLFKLYPGCKEGFLTLMRSKMVNRENLNRVAILMGFDELVLIRKNGIPAKKHIYGNALEALIGAIYIDKGFNKTKQFIIKKIISLQPGLVQLACEERDFKSRIIQWGQKNKQEISFESYELNEAGKPEPVFVATIYIMDAPAGEGLGATKKEAQQDAARQALENLPSGPGLNNIN